MRGLFLNAGVANRTGPPTERTPVGINGSYGYGISLTPILDID
jgi:hypothetical protein